MYHIFIMIFFLFFDGAWAPVPWAPVPWAQWPVQACLPDTKIPYCRTRAVVNQPTVLRVSFSRGTIVGLPRFFGEREL